MDLSRVHLVLVRTRNPQNLGAAARAMKGCGLTRLTLVAPVTDEWVTARRIAVHADDLLAAPRTVGTLAEALGEASWVVGTSSRHLEGRRRLTPKEFAEEAALRSHEGEVALVFGDEESGLSNADLLACDALSCIPAALDQPSFNLAQAVVLYAYELFQRSTRVEERAIPEAPPAVRQDYARLEESLRRLLEESRFSDVDRPRHGVKELVASLRRGELSAAEAKLWLAALQAALREVIAKRR